jgi:N-acetylglucosamine malate deacetylase 1
VNNNNNIFEEQVKKVLVLSPHTDDAELGCGGTISKLLEQGVEIIWAVFSTAEDSLPKELPRDTLKREFKEVTKFLKIDEKKLIIFDYKVRRLHEKRQEILEHLIKIRNKFKPDLVIMPSLNDIHQDHQVIANETVRAFKTCASIISYELPWNHVNFNTQAFMKLEQSHVIKKYEILMKFKSQINLKRNYFKKEYIFGLANVRGTQCNAKYAEAFEVIRWIL